MGTTQVVDGTSFVVRWYSPRTVVRWATLYRYAAPRVAGGCPVWGSARWRLIGHRLVRRTSTVAGLAHGTCYVFVVKATVAGARRTARSGIIRMRAAPPPVPAIVAPLPSPSPTPTPTPVATPTPSAHGSVPTPVPTATPKPTPTPTPAPPVVDRRSVPAIAWGVPAPDLPKIKALGFNVVLKRFQPGVDPLYYFDLAKAAGVKVLAWFPEVYTPTSFNPAALDPWVTKVRTHPALYGYVSVVEPAASALKVTLPQLRILYSRLKTLDPGHPVIVSYGHLWKFGIQDNPFAKGVADAIIVESYPVVFPSGAYPLGWVDGAAATLRNVRKVVAATAPATPIWLTIQMHEYLASNRRQPAFAEVVRQLDVGFDDLRADGLIFYPWHSSTNYTADMASSAELQSSVKTTLAWLRQGRFNRPLVR